MDNDAPYEPWPNAGPLAVVVSERRRMGRRVTFNPRYVQAIWAFAWFVGFGTAYLAHGPHRVIPGWLGPVVPAVLISLATVASIIYGQRVQAGISGPSRTSATMYGWAWTLGFICLGITNTALARRGLSSDAVDLLWAGSSLLLVGIMHLAGGALWRDRVLYATGAWTMLASAGAVLVGVPGNYLVLALAGGGGFAVLAVWTGRGRA